MEGVGLGGRKGNGDEEVIPAMGTKGSSTAWKVQKGMSFAARMAAGSPAPQMGAAAAQRSG